MKKIELEEIESLYQGIVGKFDRKCHICRESYDKKNRKGKRPAFVLHHRKYPKGWKTWADFKMQDKNGKMVYDKLNYLRYLIPKIQALQKKEANEIFRLMHHKHHFLLETLSRHKPENLERLFESTREINRMKFNKKIV